ncbi:3-hydroxyacyl-CoA dehydrogenase [Rhodobacteraceae bacterium NNCM2]|nr:3-hydroxyacyl-CoA dehydrogenase [Coraliihabitans acroporae]
MKSVETPDYVLGIVGAGAMGQGIAQVAVAGGIVTRIHDSSAEASEKAQQAVAARLRRLVEKNRMTAEEAEAAIARLSIAGSISDLAPCDTVVEAIVEKLEIKQAVFAELEKVVSPDSIIASNTSSIPIASIARACSHRHRIAGLHFFNPVPLMRLVEVIRATETSDETVATLTALGERMTRTPVTVTDSPGFLVNMGGRAFSTEGLRIAHERVATPSQIDAIMRDCHHFRMGPFELLDLTGIDVNFPVSNIVYEGYFHDPRLKTSPNHRAMFDAGLLGRKTGAGWFRYQDGKPVDVPSPDHDPNGAAPGPVVLLDDDPALAEFCEACGIQAIADDGESPILAAPVGMDATGTAVEAEIDHRRLVCVDLIGDTTKRVTLMTAPGADPAMRDRVAASVIASGRAVTAIKDSAGFVGQRLVAMVANLGCYMAEIGLASPADIDTAMRLGLNYPHGPLEFVEFIGTSNCLTILDALQGITGEDRYRPTQWLSRREALGLPIHTPS